MTKFSGYAGYATQVEVKPGIFEDQIVERKIRGDLLGDVQRRNAATTINDEITITNRLSIIADKYMNNNMTDLVYVKMDGQYWKVSSIENQRPRLLVYFGGLWHGKTASEDS